jgi:hypothetical protein
MLEQLQAIYHNSAAGILSLLKVERRKFSVIVVCLFICQENSLMANYKVRAPIDIMPTYRKHNTLRNSIEFSYKQV